MVAPRGGMRGLLWGGMRDCSGGACVVAPGGCVVAPRGGGGHAWLLLGGCACFFPGGVCVVFPGGMCGFSREGVCMVFPGGAFMVAPGGHAWFFPGEWGACMVFSGGACIGYDEIRSMSGRYALECILVFDFFSKWEQRIVNCLLQLLLSCVGLSYNQDEHFKFIVHENQYLSLKPFYDCRSGYTDCPNYRPQTKFAKVMFLHLSVSHSVHGGRGVYLSACLDTHIPWEQTPHPGSDTPLRADTHPAQCMLGDTGNNRTVRILLECRLVLKIYSHRDTN